MKKTIACSVMLFAISACSSLPGAVNKEVSEFDGTTSIRMEPNWVYKEKMSLIGADFKLGAFWNSSQPNDALIIAEIPTDLIIIQSKDGLQFNVDGKIHKLSSYQGLTDYDSTVANNVSFQSSKKSFGSSIEFIDKLLSANDVRVKLVTEKGSLTGSINSEKSSGLKQSLAKFRENIK